MLCLAVAGESCESPVIPHPRSLGRGRGRKPGEQGLESLRLRKLPDFHLWFLDIVQLGREGITCSSWHCSDCVSQHGLDRGAGAGS